MYKLDLLKGRNIPKKPSRRIILLALAAFSLPVIIGFYIFTGYMEEKKVYLSQSQIINDYKLQLSEMKESEISADKILLEIHQLRKSLTDIADVLERQYQWSGILTALSRNLPEILVVDRLQVKVDTVNKPVKQKIAAKKKRNIPVPVRTLIIGMYSYSLDEGDEAVRDFIDSRPFGNSINEVIVSSREAVEVDRKKMVRYELKCPVRN